MMISISSFRKSSELQEFTTINKCFLILMHLYKRLQVVTSKFYVNDRFRNFSNSTEVVHLCSICADFPARTDLKNMTRPTGYFACEMCHAKAVAVKLKDSKKSRLTWPPITMGKEERTLQTMQEQSDRAKAQPGLDPKENKGQRGNYRRLQEITTNL